MENRTGASAPPAEESVNRAKSAAETALGDVKQVAREAASTLKSTVKEETETVREKAMDAVGDAQLKAADQARTAANAGRLDRLTTRVASAVASKSSGDPESPSRPASMMTSWPFFQFTGVAT